MGSRSHFQGQFRPKSFPEGREFSFGRRVAKVLKRYTKSLRGLENSPKQPHKIIGVTDCRPRLYFSKNMS